MPDGDTFKLEEHGTVLGINNNSGSKFILDGSSQNRLFSDTDSSEQVIVHGRNDAINNSIVGLSGTLTSWSRGAQICCGMFVAAAAAFVADWSWPRSGS